jgi:hypothetical protein
LAPTTAYLVAGLTANTTYYYRLRASTDPYFDPDAAAFFSRVTTAGGSLTTTEQNAVNTLVLDMKAAGIWTPMKAIYPMVGASAAACAQNLRSASFTGAFSSGWTFASTGVTPNGTSATMNTLLNPTVSLSTSSAHLSFYSRTNVNQSTYDFCAGQDYSLLLYSNTFYVNLTNSGIYSATFGLGNTLGFYIASRTNNTNVNGYRNASKVINNALLVSNLENSNLYLSSRGGGSLYSSKQCAFASIGDGLTDTQASNFYTAVQAFQTTLSRQV